MVIIHSPIRPVNSPPLPPRKHNEKEIPANIDVKNTKLHNDFGGFKAFHFYFTILEKPSYTSW